MDSTKTCYSDFVCITRMTYEKGLVVDLSRGNNRSRDNEHINIRVNENGLEVLLSVSLA